jgi:DNA primase catalytic core
MIAQQEIARLKNGTDLVALVRSRGIELRRKGRSFQGRCPFHEDGRTPSFSVSPDKGLWRCFGCGAGGDAIRFLELHDKVGFPDAVRALGGSSGSRRLAASRNGQAAKERGAAAEALALAGASPVSSERTAGEIKLLSRVADFYHRAFLDDPRGAAYLRDERGIRDSSLFEAFRIGLATGKLREALPKDGEVVEGVRALGVLTERGTELLYGSIVFPLEDAQGQLVSLYGRRILEGETRHLYLPGPRRGLFNRQAVRTAKELVLVEGILDALSLIDGGYSNVLPLDGTEGLREEHLDLLRREQVREVYLALDGDAAGRSAAEKVALRLRQEGIRTVIVRLPQGKDPSDIVREGCAAAFEALLKEADPEVSERSSMPFHRSRHGYARTAEGFRVAFSGDRVYEVRGISRTPSHLRCAVRAARGARFHLDALDLYAARARQALARACAALFGVAETVVSDDLSRLLEYAEAWSPAEPAAEAPVSAVSPGEREEALRLLGAPDLLDQIQRDLGTIGTVGEQDNRLLCYLAALSRKLSEPLSVLIVSRSAAGKSHLADAVVRLVPREELRRYTRVTGQALFYTEEEALRHKLVSIEEAAGAEEAAYSIRTLQSAGELTVAVTTKDPRDGRLRTDEYHVKGPASFLVTSTSSELDPETQSRFLVLAVDESRAATERILSAQREAQTLEGLSRRREADAIARRHHAMQRLLEPISVVIPFAPRLRFPSGTLRARRDHKKYLGLIETVAFLHQHQRERKQAEVSGEPLCYIEATVRDVALVNRLALSAFSRTLDELSPQARSLLSEIRELCEEQAKGEVLSDYTFRRRDLRHRSGWSETQLRQHLGEIEQHEIIEPVSGRQGKEYLYHLSCDEEGRPLALDLASEEELSR